MMVMMMTKMMVLTKGSIISSMARHPLVCSPSVSKMIVPPWGKGDEDGNEDATDDDATDDDGMVMTVPGCYSTTAHLLRQL